jgi:hypothetical protein
MPSGRCTLAERYGQLATVHTLACSHVIVIKADGIHLGKGSVAAVVADVVVAGQSAAD